MKYMKYIWNIWNRSNNKWKVLNILLSCNTELEQPPSATEVAHEMTELDSLSQWRFLNITGLITFVETAPCIPKAAVACSIACEVLPVWMVNAGIFRVKAKILSCFTYQAYLGQLLESASRVLRTFNYLVSHMICNTQGWIWNLMKLFLIWGYGLTSLLEMT